MKVEVIGWGAVIIGIVADTLLSGMCGVLFGNRIAQNYQWDIFRSELSCAVLSAAIMCLVLCFLLRRLFRLK